MQSPSEVLGARTSTQALGERDTAQPVSPPYQVPRIQQCWFQGSHGDPSSADAPERKDSGEQVFSPPPPSAHLSVPALTFIQYHPGLALNANQSLILCAISPPPQAPRGSNAPETTKHFPLAPSPLPINSPLPAALKEQSRARWLGSPHSLL